MSHISSNISHYLLVTLFFLSLILGCGQGEGSTESVDGPGDPTQTTTAQVTHSETFILAGDDSLYVKVVGNGHPLLLVHGGPGLSHDYFLPHMLALAGKYQLIFYDQRASGRSSIDVDSNSVSLHGFISDMEDIRKHLDIDRWSILGHSWGGLLTLHYALEYPERVARLVLVSAIPGSSELQQEIQAIQKSRETAEDSLAKEVIMATEAFKNGEIAAYESLFKALFTAQFYDRNYADSLELAFQPSFLEGNRKLRYLSKDVSDYDIHLALEPIKSPSLLIYGAHDPLSGDPALLYARYLPSADLIIIPHAGHFPFIEQKPAFFQAVTDFLADESQDL
ncbi:MAG: alpha/beta fold hydrolase [Saprospiraceae bacterium]|nr:alpha/beta fold hydrolase [Saprospiraceae bacterium]